MATALPDPASVALRFCEIDYPGATTIVLGGSSSTGHRTATSDVDILVIAPASTFEVRGIPRNESGGYGEARVVHREGERIDVFAYTVEGYTAWAERDFASLRPVLPYLLTEGTPLRTGAEFPELRERSGARLAMGPRPPAHQLTLRRYAATDLLDDLSDATDPLAAAAIRGELLRSLAELALLDSNAWLGSGKWLARRLATADAEAADQLAAFAQEPDNASAARIASRLLGQLGGRVDTDIVR